MFGLPVPSAVLPAFVRETPTRTSRSDVSPSVRVTPAGDLLIQHLDVGVRRAAGVAWNGRRFEVVHLAMAEADEGARRAVDLLVDLDVELVVVVLRGAAALSKLFETPGRVGAGRPASTWRANGVIAACGTTPSA